MPDLFGLSDREREILHLLGEGHTAKSVAQQTGLSVAAVNERLRAARRKSGVGSCRELARRLRGQENRDEEMGLPHPGETSSSLPEPVADRHVSRRIIMPVSVIAALAAAVAAQHLPVAQPASTPTAPAPDTVKTTAYYDPATRQATITCDMAARGACRITVQNGEYTTKVNLEPGRHVTMKNVSPEASFCAVGASEDAACRFIPITQ